MAMISPPNRHVATPDVKDSIIVVQNRRFHTKARTLWSAVTKVCILCIPMVVNTALGALNRKVLLLFPYPSLLSAIHLTATCYGSIFLCVASSHSTGHKSTHIPLSRLFLFSPLFMFNIVAANTSMARISRLSNQVIRTLRPVFTVALHHLVFSASYPSTIILPMFLMLLALACVLTNDNDLTFAGFNVAILGVAAAALKTVAGNALMQKYDSSVHGPRTFYSMLARLSGIAALQAFAHSYTVGELSRLGNTWHPRTFMWWRISEPSSVLLLCLNVILAFVLNLSSLKVNKRVGPLMITLPGSVKLCGELILNAMLSHDTVGITNAMGLIMLVLGLIWSSVVCRTFI